MKIQQVAVLGVGTMGHGIALVSAKANYKVFLYHPHKAEWGKERIKEVLDDEIKKGRISERVKQKTLDNIFPVDKLEALSEADLIIEAVKEDMTTKKEIFKRLDLICSSKTVFASNTSTLSITEMATATKRPEKVVGIHFFAPPYRIPLVELIWGRLTSRETMEIARTYSEAIERIIVEVKDTPGFIANRILMPMINEAIWMYMEGIASKEDIDLTMQIGISHPMGPLFLADFVGLDIVLSAMETLYRELGEKYAPCPLLKEMVARGELGRKTKKGFYTY